VVRILKCARKYFGKFPIICFVDFMV